MRKAQQQQPELVLIPSPGFGHLVPMVEIANLLAGRHDRLAITILIIKIPFDSTITTYTQLVQSAAASQRIRFLELPVPSDDHRHLDQPFSDLSAKSPGLSLQAYINSHKSSIIDFISEKISTTESQSQSGRTLAGFMIDAFCTPLIDLGEEFGVPTYVFFTSGAAFLGLMSHLQNLPDTQNHDATELNNSDAELTVPGFTNPVPAKVLPSTVLDKDTSHLLLDIYKRFRESNGMLINSFVELEPQAINSLSVDDEFPKIYPVGPVLNLKGYADETQNHRSKHIMSWLDSKPPSSVVYLCFGSRGSFEREQVVEIARALENSGHRFLWSLRPPSLTSKAETAPEESEYMRQVLPKGFLERTAEVGKVLGWAPQMAALSHPAVGGFVSHCGWAPQMAALSHPAVGGFVSHCGWNSTLESMWFGVSMAAWPIYAEQQVNAFQLVKDLGLAVEIKVDYRKEAEMIVMAEEIESGIHRLMDGGDHSIEVRVKVREMSEKSRLVMTKGGSSHEYLGQFIEDMINDIQ